MLAKAKELAVAVQQLVNVIAAFGQGNAEIAAFDILLMRCDAVYRTRIGGVFFTRKKLFTVICKELKVINGFPVRTLAAIDKPLAL